MAKDVVVMVEELAVRSGRSSSESKNGRGDVGGVENMSSTGSNFIATGEFCLKGCDGVGEGEVNVFDLGMIRIGKILKKWRRNVWNKGAIYRTNLIELNALSSKLVHSVASSAGSICRMELDFVNEGNRLSVVDSKQWCLNEVKAMQRGV
ncbi:hypothetical protein Tco_1401112 [Tanacetum coccineum]